MAAEVWHGLYIWRIVVLSLGAFTIGFASAIGVAYARGRYHSGVYGTGRHVLILAASYIILAGELIYEIAQRAVYNDPITWRLPVATVAFGMGIWGLSRIARVRARAA